jgi:hypothetical protein
MRLARLALIALVSLSACKAAPPRAKLSETLPHIPMPPNAEVLSSSGSEDALQVRFRSPLQPDQVAAYYREVLKSPPWKLVKDDTDPDGGIVLYAEQNGPPLWVTIRKAEGARGSLVDLAGAKVKPKS